MLASLPKISFLLYTFFLTYNLVTPLTYKNSGYEIYDLESTTEEQFAIEAAKWTASPLVTSTNPIYTQCGSAFLLGGYKVINNVGQYERTYNNLPDHNSVHVLISFYFIDRWEPQDTVSATVTNGAQTYYSSTIFKLDSGQSNWVNSICGDTSKDLPDVTLMMGFLHTGSDLKITISNSVSNSNPNRGYNGFRDVRIISSMDTALPTSSCSLAPTGSVDTTYKCECDSGKFKGTNGCESCDESCEDCFAAGPNSCASCKSNYVYSGTQCLKCHSSCATCSGTEATQCMTCPSGWYLYPDSTCSDQCTGAHKSETVNGILTCKLNCPAPKYFYTNDSCLDDCNSPFTVTSMGSDLACNFPCGTTNFYVDGSCQDTCPSFYKTRDEGGYKYCDFPCQTSQYLFEDGTCIDTCDSPMISTDNNGKKSCKTPCQNSNMFYYPSTKSCESTCKDTYTSNQEQYYKTCTLTSEPTKETVVLKTVNTAADKVSGTGLVVTSIVSSGSPSGAMLGVLTKTFAYIRYLEIVYSTQLQQLLETFDTSFIPVNMDSEPPKFVSDESKYKTAPEVFAKWDIHPSFLANFWSDMISFAIAAGALALFKVLEVLFLKTIKREDFSGYAGKGKVATQNFLLTFFYNSYGDILFFSVLEFRSTTFGSAKSYIIVPIIIFFIVAGIIIFAFHVWLLKKYQLLSSQCVKNRKSPELKQFLEKYKGAEMVYKGFKPDTFLQQACLLFMTFRDGLFNLIFIFLFDYPLFQVITIMVLNVSMLVYLAIKRPLQDKLEQVHQIASEFLVFMLNTFIMVMAVLDNKGLDATGAREGLGKAVIIINIIFNALIALVMAIKVAVILKKMYKVRKEGIKRMLEELNSSKEDVETMYSVQSEMHTLDKFSCRFTKADGMNDLTFEASAPKDNPVLHSRGVDKYLGTGLERRSAIFETEMREETQETQRNDEPNSAAFRNPRLEPSSPIVIPVPDDQPLKNAKVVSWNFSTIGKKLKSALNKSSETDVSVGK